jgi:protein gp37
MKQAHRFSGPGKPYEGLTKKTQGPQWTGIVRSVEDVLLEPLSWRKPQRVFVNSMSDLFHEDVPDAFIDQVFNVMAYSPQHTFQVLTKRPERMRAYLADSNRPDAVFDALYSSNIAGRLGRKADRALCRGMDRVECRADDGTLIEKFDWPLPNVWLGVSCEDQPRADERIPLLLETPAAVRFVSVEPLLGPIDVSDYLDPFCECETRESLPSGDQHDESCPAGGGKLDWVIVGGESGPGARPMDLAWARSIVQQCDAAGVACFVKQLGAKPSCSTERVSGWGDLVNPETGELVGSAPWSSGKHADPSEWPEDLRVRQFPEGPA